MAEQQFAGLDKARSEHTDMCEDWELTDALMGGTRTMRELGREYLPQWTMEHDDDYTARLRNATLLPAYKETVEAYTGRVFAEPMSVDEETPAWLQEEVFPDVDTQGRNLQVFLKDVFRSALNHGIHYVLVDAPYVDTSNMSREEQRAQGLRPYAFDIHPKRIIGWKQRDGVLTQVRIRFTVEREEGLFGVRSVEQIRVYELGSENSIVNTYEKDSEGVWVLAEEERRLPFKGIPLIPFYTGRRGYMVACPPLRELAYLNAKHWNQQSSLDSLLQTACIPLLCTIGLDDNSDIVVGSKSATNLPINGDMKFVEHSGQALSTGRDQLKDLEHSMLIAGATLLQRDDNIKTATQAREEATRSNSLLANVVEGFQDAANQLIHKLGEWRTGTTVPAQPVEIQANLDPQDMSHESMPHIRDMVQHGALSRQTWFEEAKRRGLLYEELDWAVEQERIDGVVL